MAAQGYYGGDEYGRNNRQGYGNQGYEEGQYGNQTHNNQRYAYQSRREEYDHGQRDRYEQQNEHSQGDSYRQHDQGNDRLENNYGNRHNQGPGYGQNRNDYDNQYNQGPRYGQNQDDYNRPNAYLPRPNDDYNRPQIEQQQQQQQPQSYGGYNGGSSQYNNQQSNDGYKQHNQQGSDLRYAGNQGRQDSELRFGYGSGSQPPNPTGDHSLPQGEHGRLLPGIGGGAGAAVMTHEADQYQQRIQPYSGGQETSPNGQPSMNRHDFQQTRPPPNMRGNFSGSSQDITLRGTKLLAKCRDTRGNNKTSEIDINDLLTNEWGTLKWMHRGNFAGSARNIRLSSEGKVLECELNNGQGGWTHNMVYLDERLGNDNGNLVFVN